jgi:hypothetical protein
VSAAMAPASEISKARMGVSHGRLIALPVAGADNWNREPLAGGLGGFASSGWHCALSKLVRQGDADAVAANATNARMAAFQSSGLGTLQRRRGISLAAPGLTR